MSARLRAGVALLLALLLVPAAAAATGLDEARRLLDEAKAAFLDVEFETAQSGAERALQMLEGRDPRDPKTRELLVRAWGLLVQARYGLGDEAGSREAIDRVLDLDPSFDVDVSTAGPKLKEMVRARRLERIGQFEVSCSPLPCTEVLVDGLPATPAGPDQPNRFLATAGEHTLTLKRRTFRDKIVPGLEVTAGQTRQVITELTQVARDVALRTEPPGAMVLLDGKELGRTAGDAGTSDPFLLEAVPPGPHVLVLRAECHERYEQRLDVVLDKLNPGPIELGVVRLAPARASVDLAWSRPEGVLSIDGRPVDPGRREVCPGPHEFSLSLAGRRVWFERVELSNGQSLALKPSPRPTVALAGQGRRLGDLLRERGWNVLELPDGTELDRALAERLHRGDVPFHPRPLTVRDERLARLAAAAAPEADLVASWVDGSDMVRPTVWLAFVLPRQGLFEATAFRAGDPDATKNALALFNVSLPATRTFLGFDLADRRDGPPVVATVHPGGPAQKAGIEPGMILTAIDGEPVANSQALAERRARIEPGERLTLSFGVGQAPRVIELTAGRTLVAPNPARLTGLLAPALARASVERLAGEGVRRVAGGLWTGMILARLGETEAAARTLDRTTIEPELDPTEDARGTVLLVLERLFRSLANEDYAAELRARRALLKNARFGGREGPPLRLAGAGAGAPAPR